MIGKSINTIVKEFIDEEEGETLDNLRRYRGFAINGARELHMDEVGAPSFKLIEIEEGKNYFNLPADCIAPLRVAELRGGKRLRNLLIDDDMLLSDDKKEFKSAIYTEDGSYHFFDNKHVDNSRYRRDYKNNRIKVQSNKITGCIYLEYLADIQKIGADYMVGMYDIEYIKAWIRWCNVRSNIKLPRTVREEFKELMIQAKDKSSSRQNAMTVDEFTQEVRKTYQASPRM